jgi:hypothetical protein
LERVGGWERVIAWAQARQIRPGDDCVHAQRAGPQPGLGCVRFTGS